MTTPTLQALLQRHREIASAATPGPWKVYNEQSHYGVRREDSLYGRVTHAHAGYDGYGNGSSQVDAEYIATFDPTTVVALLDVAEAAQEADWYMGGGEATDHRRFDSKRAGYAYCSGCGNEWPCPAVALHTALNHLAEVMKGEME